MKRILCLLLLAVMVATMLCACGKFTCSICKESKSGEQHNVKVNKRQLVLCEDCYKLASYTCTICKQEKIGDRYDSVIANKPVTMCPDCRADWEELRDLFGEPSV